MKKFCWFVLFLLLQVEYCPHDLFINTKVDLGPCEKIHDDNLKQTFQMAENSREKERRQEDFLKYIQRLLGDADTRIRRAKEQFRQRQREALAKNGISPEIQEEIEMKIEILDEKINALIGEAETLGNSGEVEEAKGRFKLADELKNEKQELQDSIKIKPQIGETGQFGPAREMEVCDTCGALVEIYVASNVEDHNNGKMHAGYVRLKASVEALKDVVAKRREVREAEMQKERDERRAKLDEEKKAKENGDDKKGRSKSRERGSGRKRSRSRRRSRSRDGRKRSRSKSRRRRSRSDSRARRNRRDRSRSRERRRSRDRRERERRRSRSRGRKDRSRSRDRKRDRS